jgi:hypothetical protein
MPEYRHAWKEGIPRQVYFIDSQLRQPVLCIPEGVPVRLFHERPAMQITVHCSARKDEKGTVTTSFPEINPGLKSSVVGECTYTTMLVHIILYKNCPQLWRFSPKRTGLQCLSSILDNSSYSKSLITNHSRSLLSKMSSLHLLTLWQRRRK